jgi:O-antigen/teichoic acid export membrane protein
MKEFIKKLLKSEYLGNISIQVFGTGLAQLIPIAIMPFLSRIFSEEDFALYASFMAIVGVLSVATGARYQYAIVLPKKEAAANNVYLISIYYTIFYAIVLQVVAVVLYLLSVDAFHLEESILLVPIYILFQGLWLSVTNLSIRQKKFKRNAVAKIVQTSGNAVTTIALGLANVSLGLVLGKLLGLIVSVVFLIKKTYSTSYRITKETFKTTSLKYIDFPKYSIIPAFLNAASTQAPVFFIGKYYTEQDLGYYGLTFMAIAGPLSIISVSFRDVFYQKMSEVFNQKKYQQLFKTYRNNAMFLFLLGMPVIIILFFFGEPLFEFIFGENWKTSGTFASLLVFSFAIKLVVSPLSIVFNIVNKLKTMSQWQIIYFISTIVMMLVSKFMLNADIMLFLKIYVVHEIILYSYYFILQYSAVKKVNSWQE